MIQKLPSLDEAKRLWQANQREEARQVLEAIVQYQPHSEQAWLMLARASTDRNRQREALQRVLEINPKNESAQRVYQERFGSLPVSKAQQIQELLAEVIFAENWSEAEVTYAKILDLDPTQPDALNAVLRNYAQAGTWQKGFRLLNELRSRDPKNDYLVERQLKFAIRSESLDYLRSLDSVLLKHPSVTAEDLLKVSELFTKGRQYEVVAMLLDRAAELDPHNQVILYGLANAYDITKRPNDAKRIRQRITDVNRHTDLGKSMMMRFLEEDPYVPLSMRENTLVAVREAVGMMIPLALLIILDNRLSLLGTERLMGFGFGFLGFYLLVTATSSHEQKIWQQLVPGGLTESLRYIIGGAGTVLVVVAMYFALMTSFGNMDDFDTVEERGCRELMASVPNVEEEYPDYTPNAACNWLYAWDRTNAPD